MNSATAIAIAVAITPLDSGATMPAWLAWGLLGFCIAAIIVLICLALSELFL